MKRRRVPALLLDAAAIVAALLDAWVHVDPDDRAAAACALLAAISLTLRRRLPLLTYVLALPAAFVTDAVFATLAALYTLSSLTRRRSLLVVCAAAFVTGDTASWSWPGPEFADLTDSGNLITVTYSLATAAAPVFLGQLVQARRELTVRIAEISKARESERQLLSDSAQAQERARLAREMHDVISHQVSLIAVRAGALQIGNRDPETKEAAATIRRLGVQTLDELRHMVGVLRASGSDPVELTPQPSLTDLPRLVDSSGIEVELHTDLPADLPAAVQRAVYRTVQEALTNVRKHAPGATATIGVHHTGGTLRTTVTNTARTRPALVLPGAHYGLIGLRQRAELLGGTLSAAATPDGGFSLRLELPVQDPG
ncbi:histidine kinase [Streptomyces kunmingensis]|uniref:histidine kinase n=1 Tax=Streptomyces kunmingensis TaxID=68225 RepID=A0ABU6C9Y7_9ACTN|nr:histidine kinase [Streptomyces kunmingensis]MEB3961524.1 histidine kinase [Streptomyces kunmingensis]